MRIADAIHLYHPKYVMNADILGCNQCHRINRIFAPPPSMLAGIGKSCPYLLVHRFFCQCALKRNCTKKIRVNLCLQYNRLSFWSGVNLRNCENVTKAFWCTQTSKIYLLLELNFLVKFFWYSLRTSPSRKFFLCWLIGLLDSYCQ